METHLNLAHRSHRKAEFYTAKHQFIEAIFHYTKASAFLEKAILCTRGDGIRSSLIVQREHCAEQICSLTRRLNNRVEQEQASEQNTSKTSVDSIIKGFLKINMDRKDIESKYRELYNVMNEHDSLLSCLITDDPSPTSQAALSSTVVTPVASTPVDELKFKKKPKEDKEKIEELKVVNQKLRQWIDHLVEQLEKSQKEVNKYQEENVRLRKDLKTLEASQEQQHQPQAPLDPPKLLY